MPVHSLLIAGTHSSFGSAAVLTFFLNRIAEGISFPRGSLQVPP
ncbi:MAG: hypothetical protein ACTFAK_08080 [Candidatus Electronema sp. VV]